MPTCLNFNLNVSFISIFISIILNDPMGQFARYGCVELYIYFDFEEKEKKTRQNLIEYSAKDILNEQKNNFFRSPEMSTKCRSLPFS